MAGGSVTYVLSATATVSISGVDEREIFRCVKFGEGYTDYQSQTKDKDHSIGVSTYRPYSGGTIYYDKENGIFTTEVIEGSLTYEVESYTVFPQGTGEVFDSKFTTCNLIFDQTPYIYANNRAFIHAATSMGLLAVSNIKGGRYEDDDAEARLFPLYMEASEPSTWNSSITPATSIRYKYNKQLFIKEITSISTQSQSVKFNVVATLSNGNDDIAINSVIIRAGEIIFIGGE